MSSLDSTRIRFEALQTQLSASSSFNDYIEFLLTQRSFSLERQNSAFVLHDNSKNTDIMVSLSSTMGTHHILRVQLIVDNRERKNKKDPSYIVDQLKAAGCPAEARKLELGDIIWIGFTDSGMLLFSSSYYTRVRVLVLSALMNSYHSHIYSSFKGMN
jgi:hypothetical protein